MTTKLLLDELSSSGILDEGSPAKIIIPLYRVRDTLWLGDKDAVKKFDLTWGEFETLVALLVAAPSHLLKPGDLYDRMVITSGGLTKILKSLEAKQHITMEPNKDDGRSQFARVTPRGKKLVKRILPMLDERNCEKLDDALSKKEQKQLATLLGKLMVSIDR